MSEESIHDIIREMMNCTAVKSKVPHSTVEDILNPPIIRFNLEQRTIVRDFAYRIEAAAERERVKARHDAEIEWTRIGYDERKAEEKRAHGNAAALREALKAVRGDLTSALHPNTSRAIIDAALAAPARNCDRFEDGPDALFAYKDTLRDGEEVRVPWLLDWLFEPAKGDAK